MKTIQTEIIINATPQTIWNTLVDFENYPNWNPFILIKGKLEEGAILENTIYLEGQKPQTFKPTILDVQPNELFQWKGQLFVKGIFDGQHYFRLEAIGPNTTKLIHGEEFSGLLSGLIFRLIGASTKNGFEQMNQALKKECESTDAIV